MNLDFIEKYPVFSIKKLNERLDMLEEENLDLKKRLLFLENKFDDHIVREPKYTKNYDKMSKRDKQDSL